MEQPETNRQQWAKWASDLGTSLQARCDGRSILLPFPKSWVDGVKVPWHLFGLDLLLPHLTVLLVQHQELAKAHKPKHTSCTYRLPTSPHLLTASPPHLIYLQPPPPHLI